jgi:spore coat polysaccharide biosynthesis protein SpsF
MLEVMVENLSKANLPLIVATTTDKSDDVIEREARRLGVDCYRGHYTNIVKRLYDASYGHEYLIRVTGDDPFTDLNTMKYMLSTAQDLGFDYVYPKNLIRGCDCEIIKRKFLSKIMDKYDTEDFESLEYLLHTGKTNPYEAPKAYRDTSTNLTVDTEDDWRLSKIVQKKLYGDISIQKIVELFNNEPYLKDINKKPKVTVYTAHKNYTEWLDYAVKSVLMQSFTDFEYIIVDYGSNLQNLETVMKYTEDDNIRLYRKKGTFIDAIKYAISKAKGKYVIRVDADDILRVDALDCLVSAIENGHNYAAVIPEHVVIDKDNRIVDTRTIPDIMSCALIEKKRYNYVNFTEGQSFRDGMSLFKGFLKYDFQIGKLHKSMFNYRVHDKSLTHSKDSLKRIQEEEKKIVNSI